PPPRTRAAPRPRARARATRARAAARSRTAASGGAVPRPPSREVSPATRASAIRGAPRAGRATTPVRARAWALSERDRTHGHDRVGERGPIGDRGEGRHETKQVVRAAPRRLAGAGGGPARGPGR